MKKLLSLFIAAIFCSNIMAQHTITVSLTTDRFGSETTWKIINLADNTVIARGGPYADLSSSGTTEQRISPISVDGTGCYVFYIYDAYDDGICCNYGNGSYEVAYDGVTVASGGAAFSENIHFINPSECASNAIALQKLTFYNYFLTNTSFSIKGSVINRGTANLTSFTVRYKVDDEEWSSAYTVSCNIDPLLSGTFTHNVPCTIATAGRHTIEVEVSAPNGEVDATDDNILSKDVMINEQSVNRRPLLELFATAHCSNCPSAMSFIDNLLRTRTDIIKMVHHVGYYEDDYTIPESRSMKVFYNAGGATYTPGCMIDRTQLTSDPGPIFGVDRPIMATIFDQRLATPAYVTVNIAGQFDPSTRDLNLTVSGDVVGDLLENNPRLSVYLMENGLVGSQAGVSGNYTHNNVLRDAISVTWGDANVVTGTAGTSYSKTYSYTIPDAWNVDNLSVIAFVNNYSSTTSVNDRPVYNANMVPLNELTMGIGEHNTSRITIYPNPTSDVLNVISENIIRQIDIYNIEGQLIMTQNGGGILSIKDLSNGIYMVKIFTDKGTVVKKIVKQ